MPATSTVRTSKSTVDIHSAESRGHLAKLVMNLFEKWELSTSDQLELLGLSTSSRALLTKFKRGDPLPNSRDVLDRVGWLLAIHKGLRLLFPHNPEILYTWVKRRNGLIQNRTPLEIMLEEGLVGVMKTSRFVDFLRGQ